MDIREVSIGDGSEAPVVVNLTDRRGRLGAYAQAVSETALYFTWHNDTGDIWVADVAGR